MGKTKVFLNWRIGQWAFSASNSVEDRPCTLAVYGKICFFVRFSLFVRMDPLLNGVQLAPTRCAKFLYAI